MGWSRCLRVVWALMGLCLCAGPGTSTSFFSLTVCIYLLKFLQDASHTLDVLHSLCTCCTCENTAIYRTGATLALKMAAPACPAAAGALGRAIRACFGAAGALKMAAQACPGAASALEKAALARCSAASALKIAALARSGAPMRPK